MLAQGLYSLFADTKDLYEIPPGSSGSQMLHTGIVSKHTNYKSLLQGAWSGSRDPFFKFCPSHIFRNGEARHFKFRVPIDTQE